MGSQIEGAAPIATSDPAGCTDLIVVCCHAIYTGDGSNIHDESQWLLQSFQRSDSATGKPSEHEAFIAHVAAGASSTASYSKAMLMFSGGKTSHLERSEAESYGKVLESLLPNSRKDNCVALEEVATDSYQNLLFSILRFRQLVGRYPRSVTAVSHAFKEHRFLDLHASAIKWPAERMRVQGINPPLTSMELETAKTGEGKASEMWEKDPYGANSELAEKRKMRNYREETLDLTDLEPEVKALVLWKGGESGAQRFPGSLPWELASSFD